MAILSRSTVGGHKFIEVDEDPVLVAHNGEVGDFVYYQPTETSPAAVYMKTVAGLNTSVQKIVIRHIYDQSTAPTASDDLAKGFDSGSRWIRTSPSNEMYICFKPDIGAAVWERIF